MRPAMEPRVRALVEAGRLQVGPWYVLADELIPSGESLVRNLLARPGDGGAATAAGSTCCTHRTRSVTPRSGPRSAPSSASPMACSGAGSAARQARRAISSAGARRMDGEVLLHHLPPDGYEAGASLPADPERLPAAWARLKAELDPRARSPHVAVFVGADHHAAHPAVGRLRDLLAELEPEAEVRVSRLDEYFAAAASSADDLPRAARRAPLVVRLYLDAPGRPRDPRAAQAAACRGGAGAGTDGGAARRTGPVARGARPPASSGRHLAHAAPLAVPRLDRRMHLGRRGAAGRSATGRRSNGPPPRSPARRSTRSSATIPMPRGITRSEPARRSSCATRCRRRAERRRGRGAELVPARRAGRAAGRTGSAQRRPADGS